jgi:hypothetical protein
VENKKSDGKRTEKILRTRGVVITLSNWKVTLD